METEVWVLEIARIFAYLLAGGFVVPAVGWIRDKVNLNGYPAIVLTVIVSIIFGTAGLLAEGALNIADLTPDNMFAVFVAVFVASQVVYNMIKQ